MVYFVMPILVLGIVAGILVVNEIGHNGANIRNAYEWARCDAGIECESAKR